MNPGLRLYTPLCFLALREEKGLYSNGAIEAEWCHP